MRILHSKLSKIFDGISANYSRNLPDHTHTHKKKTTTHELIM